MTGPRRGISRHPPDHPRASSALHLRALRRSLCRFGDLLRCRRRPLQDADLQGRRSDRASLPAGIARGRRNATAPSPQQSRCRSSGPRGYRSRSAITGRASFCPAPDFAARAGARTTRSIRRSASRSPTPRPWQFAALPAPQPRAIAEIERWARSGSAMARQFLRTPRLPGRPVSRRNRASGPGHPARPLQAAARHGALHPSWRYRRRSRRRHPALATGRRPPISSSTRRTSTSGFAICT